MKKAIQNFNEGTASVMGDVPNSGSDSLNPSWGKDVEHAFSAAFAVELVVRLLALEGSFFFGPEWSWNMLDLILVISSLLDTVLTVAGFEMTYIRLLRLLRMTRTTRGIRLLRFFRTLRLMLLSALNSVVPLLWAMLFLILMIFVFAVVLLQG